MPTTPIFLRGPETGEALQRNSTQTEHFSVYRLPLLQRAADTHTGLCSHDADNLRPALRPSDVARVACIIPLAAAAVFRPVALPRAFAGAAPGFCRPRINYPYLYLPYVQVLAGIERVALRHHLGRKAFATLRVARASCASRC